ncbi:hypothetical protein [Halovivax sp.]|uniref:DUF7344 domain-containing protein n=1 Tax=Halovivax sp. TaxID=1935978 RepID=UPI0025C4640A|nr:hypothetical protein [Halovivax sp.]
MSVDITPPPSAFEIVASDHRRRALKVLRAADGPVSEGEIATRTAERLAENSPPERSPDERDRIRIMLRHVHLPMLAEADLVEWDRERQLVVPGDGPPSAEELVASALDAGARGDDSDGYR